MHQQQRRQHALDQSEHKTTTEDQFLQQPRRQQSDVVQRRANVATVGQQPVESTSSPVNMDNNEFPQLEELGSMITSVQNKFNGPTLSTVDQTTTSVHPTPSNKKEDLLVDKDALSCQHVLQIQQRAIDDAVAASKAAQSEVADRQMEYKEQQRHQELKRNLSIPTHTSGLSVSISTTHTGDNLHGTNTETSEVLIEYSLTEDKYSL